MVLLQNNPGLISFSVDEAEEEKVEKEKEEVKKEKEKEEVKKKNSGNILVVETDFERMPRRSSFRSKERRELTRYSKCNEHPSQFTESINHLHLPLLQRSKHPV